MFFFFGAALGTVSLRSSDSAFDRHSAFTTSSDDKIRSFVKALSPNSTVPSQTFSVGYAACEDISVPATDFFPLLLKRAEIRDVEPRHHVFLTSLRTVVESFLFSFQHGSNAELRVDPDIYREVVLIARSASTHRIYPGGNALCIAHRIAKEVRAHKVHLGAVVNEALRDKLNRRNISVSEVDSMDVHIAIEYKTNDIIAGISAPRMNRYYMNADIHNAELTTAPAVHKAMKSTDFFVISGLQLLKSPDHPHLSLVAEHLKQHRGGSHFESGSYEDKKLFAAIWNKGIFLNTRSLGVNEQELALLDYMMRTNDPDSAETVVDSSPDADWVLRLVLQVLRSTTTLSRIHMHALGFQVLCYDSSQWSHGRDAVAAASLVASELACGDALREHTWDSFRDLSELEMETIPGTGLRCLEGELECCVAPVLVCKVPVRTAGLGDNISGAGLARQTYIGKVVKDEL